MQVTVEKISNVECRLTIVVPANQVQDAYTKQINQFTQKANIKGFRQGKAPKSVIEQQYGQEAREKALNEVIQRSYFEALNTDSVKNQISRPISMPRIEAKSMLIDQPFEFTATFDTLPPIENIGFALDNVEKLKVDVADIDMDHVMNQLIKQYTKWNVVNRPAQEKDRVVVDYYAIFEGKSDEANKIQSFPLELGSKVMLPGFEQGLIGAKAGDEKKLSLTFPADFSIAERAGKPIEFVVNVKEVYEAKTPNIDEDFVKQLGIKTGKQEDLKNQIKQSLEHERDRLTKEKLKEQVFGKLLEQNPIEIPKSLIDKEAASIHDEVYQHQHHDHHSHSPEEMATFNDIAKKRVSLGILIAEFAKQANLQVDKDKVKKRIQEIASVYENPQEVIDYLSTPEHLNGVEAQVLEEQVLDKLLEGIPVTEKVMSYAELKGVRQ